MNKPTLNRFVLELDITNKHALAHYIQFQTIAQGNGCCEIYFYNLHYFFARCHTQTSYILPGGRVLQGSFKEA